MVGLNILCTTASLITTPNGKFCQAHRDATAKEMHTYRYMICKMLYAARMSSPVVLHHSSSMATQISELRTHQLKNPRSLLRYDKQHVPTISYNLPSLPSTFGLKQYQTHRCIRFPRVAVGVVMSYYGDMEIFTTPCFGVRENYDLFLRSSSTAELLAAYEPASALTYLKQLLAEICHRHDANLLVDLRSLMHMVTSISEPAETAYRIDRAHIRERFIPD